MHYSLASFIHRLSRLTLQDIGAALNSFIHEALRFISGHLVPTATDFIAIACALALFFIWLQVKRLNVKDEFTLGRNRLSK